MSGTHKTQMFSHRGANREAAENTQSAFDAALQYAIDGIETDVQLSSDEINVLWHDDTLEKVGLPDKHIDDLNYAALQEIDVARHFFVEARSESFMTLQSFLGHYRKRCRLLLEIKCYEGELPVRQRIKVRQTLAMVGAVRRDDIMVSSFHLPSLLAAHQYAPEFPVVYNLEPEQGFADAKQALAEHPFLHGLCVHISTLNAAMVTLLHRQKKCIAVYTCNSEEEINTALQLGVDILITDFPQKALQLRDQ
ncbi:MAG: glycerophosphodiester phosphodiesterase [Gallionella sp.]|nr:glycerophosphodiester phosphodiesterase [Gallionella sp.]